MRFFLDNNLSDKLARGMREFGEEVSHLKEHFGEATSDTQWLRYVGENELILITRDERIRWNPAELAALKKHKVGAFFLGGKNQSRCDLIRQLVSNWSRIKEIARKARRPFAFRVPPKGTSFKHIAL